MKVDLIESNEMKTVIDSDLPWAIRPDDSSWSLVPGEHIHVCNLILIGNYLLNYSI